jgi:hypothetical protein
MAIILILVLVICLGIYIINGKYLCKQFVKYASMLNTYIENLGFKPNALYATVGWMDKKNVNESIYSQATKNLISQATTLSEKYEKEGVFIHDVSLSKKKWFPVLGVFLDTNQKVFAIRSSEHETTPKVYKFSQLQSFAVSEDVKSSRMIGAVTVGWLTIGGIAGVKGSVSMRIAISGANGPEIIELTPSLQIDGIIEEIKEIKIKTDSPLYKIKCEELAIIADCLQWISDNA